MLIITLLAAVIVLAAALDLLAPLGEQRGLLTVFDLASVRSPNRVPGQDSDAIPWRARPPRAVRALAGAAALAGYGLLLRYLAATRLATLARALTGDRARMARHCANGAAALLLMASLTFLAAISVIAGPLAPLLGIALGIATLTGLVTIALPLGQRLRTWAGAQEPELISDLLSGLLMVIFVALIPYAGFVALVLLGLAGLGATAATRFGAADRWEIEPLDY